MAQPTKHLYSHSGPHPASLNPKTYCAEARCYKVMLCDPKEPVRGSRFEKHLPGRAKKVTSRKTFQEYWGFSECLGHWWMCCSSLFFLFHVQPLVSTQVEASCNPRVIVLCIVQSPRNSILRILDFPINLSCLVKKKLAVLGSIANQTLLI